MFSDKRPTKQLRLAGPPAHTRSIYVNVRLKWSHNGKREREEALLLLDTSAKNKAYTRTHPVLPVRPAVQGHRTYTRVVGVPSFIACLWTGVHAAQTHQTQPRTQKVPDTERFCRCKKVLRTQPDRIEH